MLPELAPNFEIRESDLLSFVQEALFNPKDHVVKPGYWSSRNL